MSPVKELRYLHTLIVMIVTIRKLKTMIEGVEENAEYLKKTIQEDNQIDLFDS